MRMTEQCLPDVVWIFGFISGCLFVLAIRAWTIFRRKNKSSKKERNK
jgi:hypothetical protein